MISYIKHILLANRHAFGIVQSRLASIDLHILMLLPNILVIVGSAVPNPLTHGTLVKDQWEFQDPKMEVLYHISGHILWGYSLKFRPKQ